MDAAPQTSSSEPLPRARQALILLVLINMFNYIDRQILSAVLPNLENEFTPGDPNAKAKMGALTTAFIVSYMVIAPVFGWLGDRTSRWLLVGIGVILWSLASGASGLAGAYLMLLLTRCLVGIGEGAYGPVAPGIISDLYPVSRRGSILAWFYAAIPVGSALGFVIGGLVAGSAWGWRGAFLVVVPPGILLGLLCFRMPEPRRGKTDAVSVDRKHSWKDYRVLARIPSYVLNTLGMTAMTFVLGGVAAFLPTFVYEREARFILTDSALVTFEEKTRKSLENLEKQSPEQFAESERGLVSVRQRLQLLIGEKELTVKNFRELLEETLSSDERKLYTQKLFEASQTPESPSTTTIAVIFGAIVVIAGLVATLLGGLAGDRLRGRFPGSYFLVSGAGMLVGFPLFLAIVVLPLPFAAFWGVTFLAVFFLFFNTGPTNTVLANVSPPAIRSTAFALNIFMIHALGDAISPPIIGAIADRYGIKQAFFCISFLIPISGLFWLWGAVYLKRDTELAPTRMGS